MKFKLKSFVIVALSTMAMITITTAEARRGGGGFSTSRSYSRPSYSSRPSRSYSTPKTKTAKSTFSTKAKPATKTTNVKFNAKKGAVKNSRFSKKSGFDKNKNLAASTAHKAQVAKFKKPPTTPKLTPASTKQYSSNSYVRSSYGYDRSTRLDRRSTYYNSYTPHSYAYNSSPSFGMWDSIALWYMLDNIGNRNQYAMMYNHQNDPGFQEWRREANRLSADNADLKAQLAMMDKNVGSMKGTPINESYVPEGMDADILLSDKVANGIKPTLNICSGSINGSYSTYAYKMKQALPDFIVNVTHTNGSNENILAVDSNKCDMALIQRDVYDLSIICGNSDNDNISKYCDSVGISSKKTSLNFTKLLSPFFDSVVGICNVNIDQLESAKSISLVKGGGSLTTWLNIGMELDWVEKIQIIKSKSMYDSVLNVSKGLSDCTILTTNFKSNIFRKINKLKNIQIVNINNSEFYTLLDPSGEPSYYPQRLSINALGPISENQSNGFYKRYINNPKIPVDVVISNNYNVKLINNIKMNISGLSI